MPDQIFISYRRNDAAYVTGHINDILREEFGHESVFTDVDNIALGVDFRAVLDESVSQCQVFLAVIGDNWLTVRDKEGKPRLQDPADFVRIEIESALRRNIPIIPLLVGHATMPLAEQLPEPLRDFAFRNGTPIRPPPDFNADMERLVRSLRSYLASIRSDGGEDEPAAPSPTDSVETSAQTKRRSSSGIHVGEDERVRKQVELGIGQAPGKRRWLSRVMTLAVLALAAGGWYYADRNPDSVQALMRAVQPQSPVESTGTETQEEAPVGAPTSFGAPAVDANEERPATEPATGDTEETAPEPVSETVADAEPEAPAAIEGVDERLEVVADNETADAAPPEDTEPEGIVDGEIVLTPGTQRQADAAEFIREGVSLAAIGDHEAAIGFFDQVIELDVEPAFAYRQRGASRQALGQYEAAVSDYDEAIRLNSEDVIAYYNRGVCHIAVENHTAAVADYDAVIRLDPEFADAYSKRADAHEALGNTAEAARDRATADVFESNRDDPRR